MKNLLRLWEVYAIFLLRKIFPTMKTLKFLLFASCVVLAPLSARAVGITSNGTASALWNTEVFNQQYFTLNLTSNPGAVFQTTTFTLRLQLDDVTNVDPEFDVHPFGDIYVTGQTIVDPDNTPLTTTDTYLREQSTVNAQAGGGNFTMGNVIFLSSNSSTSNASLGTNNYLGIQLYENVTLDGEVYIGTNPHYGWLQFELNSFADGTVGARFVAGHVNDTPDTDSTTGAVPEPGSLALLAAAGAGLFALRRSRRS